VCRTGSIDVGHRPRDAHGGSVVPDRQPSSCLQIAPSAEVSNEELLPEAARAEAELVGRFHYTTLVRNRPRTLSTWRVTTTSLLTADRVARLLGGHVQQSSTSGVAEIITTSSTIGILLAGPGALDIGWQRTDRDACDGAAQKDRQPCICPADFARRRAAAKQGYGCRPHAEVRFRLQHDQTAGVFDITSEDWSFVELVTTIQAALSSRETRRPVMVRVGLQRTLHTLSNGIVLPYTRPHIELLGDHPFPLASDAVVIRT
jgi:recombination directionality factor gp3-like protein